MYRHKSQHFVRSGSYHDVSEDAQVCPLYLRVGSIEREI